MKIKAVLSRTTTDMIKSKIRSSELSELVFDCYITPKQFAELIEGCMDEEIELNVKIGIV